MKTDVFIVEEKSIPEIHARLINKQQSMLKIQVLFQLTQQQFSRHPGAWKVESLKLIEKHTSSKEQELEEIRKKLQETRIKLEALEKENQSIREEVRRN